MIKVNVRTVNYPLPEGERLIFEDVRLNNEDFSGKTLIRLSFSNCKLHFCKFENMNVRSVGFGGGLNQTIFTDCSFDRSQFKGPTPGNAKFVRCSFRNVDLYEFFFLKGEFIDCIFSGKMKKVIFYRKLRSSDRETANREFNEFQGNDFRDVDFRDCDFRGGIDLTLQKLPVGDKYICIKNASEFITNLQSHVDQITDSGFKKAALSRLRIFKDELNHGQTQFFLKLDELTIHTQYINQMAELFKKAVND